MAIDLTVLGTQGMDGEDFGTNYGVVHGYGDLATYATGGIAVAVAAVNAALATYSSTVATLSTLVSFEVGNTDGGYILTWDRANGKVKSFTTGGTETTNATDLSGEEFIWVARGLKA